MCGTGCTQPLSAYNLLQKTRLSGAEGPNDGRGTHRFVWRMLSDLGQVDH